VRRGTLPGMKTWWIVLPSLLALGCATAPPTPEAELAAEPPLWLFLLAGQSNMAGRAPVEEIDRTPHPRVFSLQQDMTWGPAVEPLHWDKPDIIGVGPGSSFGRAMAERYPDVRIGLIPSAVGGSSIREWVPRGVNPSTERRPWDDMKYFVWRTLAMTGGELKGVIWHQGEADAKNFSAEHGDALVDLVARMRAEFDDPDLPFVAGELADFYMTNRSPKGAVINEGIRRLPEKSDHTAVVTPVDAEALPDGIHYDAPTYRRFGESYAEAMIGLLE